MAKFPVFLISKLSLSKLLYKSFNAKILSQSYNSPIMAPISSAGVFFFIKKKNNNKILFIF